MPFFSIFRRDGGTKSRKHAGQTHQVAPPKLKWEEAWSRNEVTPEEVHELVHTCTVELKSRTLDAPFLILPYRPGLDAVGSKNAIRNYFKIQYEDSWVKNKHVVEQELRLMDPEVLCSILRWCWSRLPGGVVTWETYDLFRIGELDSKMSKNAFNVFIPMSTDSDARKRVVFDFFDLLAAIAARGKANGLGGRKLSRLAGWYTFAHSHDSKGFNTGYKSWANAADATSHLFFAYLRSLSPDATGGVSGISKLPRSLQALLSQTEYPPETPTLMLLPTRKVVMIVNSVSPTPFALLRRARNFEYRDDDEALQRFSAYEDPVQTLTDECRRVLNAISSTNQSTLPANGAPVPEGAWSRFEDMGFTNIADSMPSPGDLATSKDTTALRQRATSDVDDMGRPTTPSWADFLSTGFPNDRSPGLLPPDKSLPLPQIEARGHSSQSHVRNGTQDTDLEPGELASIDQFDLDETFWWVWISSLAGEETAERKSVFGRCTLIETNIQGAKWLVVEEQIKGAAPGQEDGVYLAEKKGRFPWSKRSRLNRRKTIKKPTEKSKLIEEPYNRNTEGTPSIKIAPDQHAKIQAAAAELAKGGRTQTNGETGLRRSRLDENASQKTNSMMTLQPAIVSEAGPAMKWAKDFDRDAVREQYLGNPSAGTGRSNVDLSASPSPSAVNLSPRTNGTSPLPRELSDRDLPSLPGAEREKVIKSPSPPATPPHDSIDSLTREPSRAINGLDEKPKIGVTDQHPALRTKVSPEASKTAKFASAKPEEKKLPKKEAGGGGIKKLFARKRVSQPPVNAKDNVTQGQQPQKLHKTPPRHTPIQIAYNKEPTPEPSITNSSPAQSFKGQAASPYDRDISDVGSQEQEAANAEFSRFDQGPLNDVPSFAPEDTPESSVAATSPPMQNTTFPSVSPPPEPKSGPPPVPTYEPPAPETKAVDEDASEDSVEAAAPAAITSDRWAQIRKNAAERALRMEQEQKAGRSRSQSGRTDDGETSGEETIESRVARIKARVAELTGNMDTPAGAARR